MLVVAGLACVVVICLAGRLQAERGAEEKAGGNSKCYVCHAGMKTEELTTNHLAMEVTCDKCHGPSIEHMHDEMLMTEPDVLFGRSQVVAFCMKCHEGHENPEKVEAFCQEWAARMRPNGRNITDDSVCTDCHGTHNIANKIGAEIEQQKEQQWLAAFNGSDLTGWKPSGGASWNVRMGRIYATPSADGKPASLWSDAEYDDYLMAVTFRVERPVDAGIWVRSDGSRPGVRVEILQNAEPKAHSGSVLVINPRANVAILYRDVRTYGFKEQYYNQARELGVLFFRYDLDNKPVVSQNGSGNIEVRLLDLNSRLDLSFSPDVLALSVATAPSPDNETIGTVFKVPVNLEGFFLEAHMKLRPVDFASDGLFLCGACHGPKFIDESVSQAQAVAARAVRILSAETMEVSGVVSVVDADKCAACLTCVRTCPYNVPQINSDGVAEIEAAMCHGCGICASECPAKAIQLMHYKDAQVIAKTEALLNELNELVKNE